MVTKAKEA